MNKYKDFLTPEQIDELRIRRSAAKTDGRVESYDRIRIILKAHEGVELEILSEVFSVSLSTIYRYIQEYMDHDKTDHDHHGRSRILEQAISQALKEWVKHVKPSTAVEVIKHLKERFNVSLSHSATLDWLHQQGFTYKKATLCPPKPKDPQHQVDAAVELIALGQQALEEPGHVVLFMDATHPNAKTKSANAWVEKGVDFEITSMPSRERCNVVGALDANAGSIIYSMPQRVNAESTIDFLNAIRDPQSGYDLKKYPHLTLVLDNGSYYRAHRVQDHAKSLGIDLFYLPPYSPQLNLIERVWKFMNKKARDNQVFADAKALASAIENFFESWRRGAFNDQLESLLTWNFQGILRA